MTAARPGLQPRLLDLFCGAGGAAMGYHRAGFDVVGVDIAPQPHYPFEFFQADALESLEFGVDDPPRWLGAGAQGFDAIHASPPCQAYSRAGALRAGEDREHPDLVGEVRWLLQDTGLPYVIENVPGAPLIDPVQLCGTAFPSLGWTDWELQRHRLFEATFPLRSPGCHHSDKPTISVVGHGATKATRERLGRNPKIAEKRAAMGIDWMNRDELSEAIPPVYTEYVGNWLMEEVRAHVAA